MDRLPQGIREFSQKDGAWFVSDRNREEMFRRACADIVRRTGPSHRGVLCPSLNF